MQSDFIVRVEYPEQTEVDPCVALKNQIKRGSPNNPVFSSTVIGVAQPQEQGSVQPTADNSDYAAALKDLENVAAQFTAIGKPGSAQFVREIIQRLNAITHFA